MDNDLLAYFKAQNLTELQAFRQLDAEVQDGNGAISFAEEWIEVYVRPNNPVLADKILQLKKLQDEVDEAIYKRFDELDED